MLPNKHEDQSRLTEEVIRPRELMEQQRHASIIDIGRLLSHYSEFVNIVCPACNSERWTLSIIKNCFTYVRCEDCQTLFTNPRPSPELLDWFYANSTNYAYWNNAVFPASEDARRRSIVSPRVDRLLDTCKRHGINMESFLEIGAGFGTFCAEVKLRGAFSRVIAVEPTPELAMTCRNRGLDVIELPIESIVPEETPPFNVVASFEVIEHLFSPSRFLQQVVRLLKPEGILVLTCPNGLGFDIQTLGSTSSTIDHEHLNYFNPKSISILLEKCGLDVLECTTPGKLDSDMVRNAILSGSFDVSCQPLLKRILVDDHEELLESFQDFLASNGLSSHMWIVARRSIA